MYKRIIAFVCVVCFIFVAAIGRIAYIDFYSYSASADTSNTVSVTLDEKRGVFYDRYFSKLTNYQKEYVAIIRPDQRAIADLPLFFNDTEIKDIMAELKKGYPVIKKVTNRVSSSEFIQVVSTEKRYADNQVMPQTIGYKNDNNVSGLEKSFDEFLTMDSNLKISYTVDALGRMMKGDDGKITSSNYDSKRGVVLTIDKNIQEICENAVKEKGDFIKGAVVVLDVKTSEILAMVSCPKIDPNNLSDSLKSKNSPFLNRPLTAYSVGSVFKIVLAATAIENNMDNITYTCNGAINIDSTTFTCKNHTSHMVDNIKSAISRSCNTYFINLGQNLGGDKILDMSTNMGLGKETVFAEGFSSKAGSLPEYSSLKSSGALANFSFGQGNFTATPLQIANVVACIANNGEYNEPKLVQSLINDNGSIEKEYESKPYIDVMSEETSKKLRSFMIETVENGTGKNAKPANNTAGGKTATAQTGWYTDDGVEILHSWFAGFYPGDNPQYAIAIVNEEGKSGSADCCPIFKAIVDNLPDTN